MGAIVPASAFAIDELSEFFAPVSHNALEELLIYRRAAKKDIELVEQMVLAVQTGAMGYFMQANLERDNSISVPKLFDKNRAIKQLDSDMWHQAMRLTDVWDYMPQARRDKWNHQLRAWKDMHGYQEGKNPENDMLPFEPEVAVSTIKQLLAMRAQFFSEKVDGLFRGLSGEHVTNSPMGFGKRMIIARAINDYGHSDYSRAGLIDDLRMIICKFRGLPEKLGMSSSDVLQRCYRTRTGEWFDVDGGALRVRVYKVGTAHLEVHEELAWKLNKVLAAMHPAAIPSEFRQKPKKRKVKDFNLFDDLLPAPVRQLIGAMRSFNSSGRGFYFEKTFDVDKAIISEAEAVLSAVGGVKVEREYKADRWETRKRVVWEFDYDFMPIRDEIAGSGRVPNAKSHQFYPTPESLALIAVQLADIGPAHSCLEPSAGQGGLADLMPKDQTTCVEVSRLHCDILKAKGHNVVHADFLQWGAGQLLVDRVVMNPPFSEGRWQAHLEAAGDLLKPGGKLVAIVPASAANKQPLPSLECHFSEPYDNQFADASVSVVILTATRKAA